MLLIFVISRMLYFRSLANTILISSAFIAAGWPIRASFQVKITSSKFLKPIADSRNSRSTFPVNDTNLICSIIYIIIFFKAMKYNIPQILPLAIHIERYKKKF